MYSTKTGLRKGPFDSLLSKDFRLMHVFGSACICFRLPPLLSSLPSLFLPPLMFESRGQSLPSQSIHFIPHLLLFPQLPSLLHLVLLHLFYSCLAISLLFLSLSLKCLLLIHLPATRVCSHSFLTLSKVCLGGGGGRRRWKVASTPEGYPVINYSPIPHLFCVCREK